MDFKFKINLLTKSNKDGIMHKLFVCIANKI